MKTKKITAMVLAAGLLMAGCSRDRDERLGPDFAEDARTGAQVDVIIDDVGNIVEDQYNDQSITGRDAMDFVSYLPECVSITTNVSGGNWQRTVDFGATGCTLNNGNVLRGKIIMNGTTDFAAQSQTINYSFVDFYHNNRYVEGNRHVVRVLQNSAGNPQSNINLNMTVTFPSGTVVTRTGNRIRQWIAGVDTPLTALDNVYSVTGSWVTNFPNATQNTTVTSPLIVKLSCPHIVQGTLDITRNNNDIIFDYGTGTCDNEATLAINGGSPIAITLGN